jgi:biotin operon repressor
MSRYQRSFEIERRFDEMLELIELGKHSTPTLAAALGVSIPTVSRCLRALRERGYEIRTERGGSRWHYVIAHRPTQRHSRNQMKLPAHPLGASTRASARSGME